MSQIVILITASQAEISDRGYDQVNVSCETGIGIDELVEVLCSKVGFHPPENSLIARTRHLDALGWDYGLFDRGA